MTLKSRSLLLAALIASPLLLAFDLRGDALSFHPESGVSVEKELSISGAGYIDDLLFTADGEEIPAEMLGDVLDMALEFELTHSVTDVFVKSRDGRPLVLLRTYNDVSVEVSVAGESQDTEERDIVDSTVKFTWNDEDETYDITVEDGDVDEEDVEDLHVDMDFTFLLPADEVREGESWEVTGEEAMRLFMPGGSPSGGGDDLPDEALELGEMAEELLKPQIEEAMEEFVVDCTYKGMDEDGAALIEFEFKGEISLDFSELVMAAIDMQDLGGLDLDADVELSMNIELEGQGILTWDEEAGHARAFEMAVEIIIILDGVADIEAGGEAHSVEATIELSAELEYEMSVD